MGVPLTSAPQLRMYMNLNLELFSKRLKEQLKLKGVRQKDVIALLNKPQPTISRWYSGKHRPDDIRDIKKICSEYGIDFDYIVGISDVPNNNLTIRVRNNADLNDYEMVIIKHMETKPEHILNLPKWSAAELPYRMRGNGMKGCIPKGDVVVVKAVTAWKTYFTESEPYLVLTKTDNQMVVRYVTRHEDPDLLWLIPHNIEQFREMTIPIDEVMMIFEVLGTYNDTI